MHGAINIYSIQPPSVPADEHYLYLFATKHALECKLTRVSIPSIFGSHMRGEVLSIPTKEKVREN